MSRRRRSARKETIRSKTRALLWILWDSGMRVSEILALRRESVTQAGEGCLALTLPNDAPRLKTGPRTVYVYEAVPALAEWLALHPSVDPKAPLFPARFTPSQPMLPQGVTKVLPDLTARVGMRHIHPHLFRHTRATRAAEAGWNEFEMNAYFGWTGASRMASHYVHMAQLHLRDRVRAEVEADKPDRQAEVAALLTAILDELRTRGQP